jgi:hypothetical protein
MYPARMRGGRAVIAAAALAGWLCAPGAADAAGTFGIGDGSGPGVALDAAGNCEPGGGELIGR